MIPGISIEFENLIVAQLNRPFVSRAVVFGSRAKGNYKAGSDIDIALYGEISFEQLMEITIDIKELELPWLTDIVAYSQVTDQGFKKHIETYGKEFYLNSTGNHN
jgi:uncharacterized protein